ncbi:breast carcinoma-amplified sequence 3 homolog [Anthonomus grandis grandis]|uniref:breast carcinoma-amplified sequence 3 homolog n=1 Tax=Anthonomus grandis grandis TaxID=2921223 RepID=UPI0021656885|nr:breast carcinoma-amplified sequence 3 homolog [Anthonomus grandis grandis]
MKLGSSPNSPQAGGSADVPQKGIVTILDVEHPSAQNADGSFRSEAIVAHFIAHSEAIVWLQFGPGGMLLLTADKRGHDFNLFRINAHPVGSSLITKT